MPLGPKDASVAKDGSFAKDTAFAAVSSTMPTLVVLATTIAVSRLLGPTSTGDLAYALWLIAIGTMLAGSAANCAAQATTAPTT